MSPERKMRMVGSWIASSSPDEWWSELQSPTAWFAEPSPCGRTQRSTQIGMPMCTCFPASSRNSLCLLRILEVTDHARRHRTSATFLQSAQRISLGGVSSAPVPVRPQSQCQSPCGGQGCIRKRHGSVSHTSSANVGWVSLRSPPTWVAPEKPCKGVGLQLEYTSLSGRGPLAEDSSKWPGQE